MTTTPDLISHRLASLRQELQKRNLDGFLVPMADEYQNEYVPACARRLEFLSGFTGSAGFIVVLMNRAAFFTDGRYTLQATQQIPSSLFSCFDTAIKLPGDWLKENASARTRIGFDPWLHTAKAMENWQKKLEKTSIDLVPTETNPLDAIWKERPPAPCEPIALHEQMFAGKSSAEKRQNIADALKKNDIDAAVITDPASVAWLLNVRGNDVPHTPLPLSFAIIANDATVTWFVDLKKVPSTLPQYLGAQVLRSDPAEFPKSLERLGATSRRVRVDPTRSAFWIIEKLRTAGAVLDYGDDPCLLPKACKNAVELEGARAAHRRDGAALIQFMAWVDAQNLFEAITELDVEARLSAFREAQDRYCGPSFETIAGVGANGAIVHYRATENTNRKLERDTFLLVDSGGQYSDGTTDVTRTLVLGSVTPEMRDRFTRVLKGMIALTRARFPLGTTGADLDVLARQYLWEVGLDYAHGTGHGVGSYLCVHEGPQSISARGTEPLQPGMILSNEPGYYEAGKYGIRIENLMAVVEIPEISTATRKMLGFETLTLAPIDLRAIVADKLTQTEREWLNNYHARVREALRPLINDQNTLAWLIRATQEI